MENQWRCVSCGKAVKNDGQSKKCPHCGEQALFPIFPASRVRGDRYTPYHGRTLWQRLANKAMNERAQSNFQRKQQAH